MSKKMFHAVFAVIFASIAVRGFAYANQDQRNFSVYTIKPVDCGNEIAARYTSVILNSLKQEESFLIIAGDNDAAEYRIGGSIVMVTVTGGKGVTKYIDEMDGGDKFTVTINVVDAKTGKIDSSFRDSFVGSNGIEKSAGKVATQIRIKYRLIPEKKPSYVVEPEKSKEPLKENNPESRIMFSALGISPFGTIGFGKYRDYNKTGFGIGVAPAFEFGKLLIKTSFDAASGKPANGAISNVKTFRGMVHAGYFILEKGLLSVTPFFGAGVFIHRVKGDKNGQNISRTYKNGIVCVTLDFDYRVTDGYSVFMAPRYNVFFEKSRNDRFAELGFGIKFLY